MRTVFPQTLALLLACCILPTFAQEPDSKDSDGSSQQVEESDEAFRRRMELEDARHRDPTYTDPVGSYRQELEKIDKLPEESRDHLRDQLIDVIVENGEWEPSDALKDYPYKPSSAAKDDTALAQQEQEAWDEQIAKYHERESEAFGAYRGPVAGPGNRDGAEGGEGDQGQQAQAGGQQGGEGQTGDQGQAGGQQGSESSASSKSTYQPYESSQNRDSDAVSTAGVQESALDFLRGRQGATAAQEPGQNTGQPPQAAPNGQTAGAEPVAPQASQTSDSASQSAEPAAQAQNEQASAEPPSPASDEASESESAEQPQQQDLRGVIAIEDLDKLGTSVIVPPPEEEEDEDEGDGGGN
jgi:hypothetical protein